MALARLVMKRANSIPLISSSLLSQNVSERTLSEMNKQRWGLEHLRRLSSSAAGSEGHREDGEVAVSDDKNKSISPRRHRRRGSLWAGRNHDNSPSLSGVGSALSEAAEGINKLLHKLSPSKLMGRFKEKEECYKMRFYLPGFRKEEVKVNVANGVLYIYGEHKEEDGDDTDDEHWAAYGSYSTSIILPEDAKVDEIKAQMKNGVLNIVVPRSETHEKDVKDIPVD